jgi:hypothetical protein
MTKHGYLGSSPASAPTASPNIPLTMLARHERAQPRELLGHRGVQDRLHIDAALEQPRRARRVADDGGYDGEPRARAGVDARCRRQLEKQRAMLAQGLGALRLAAQSLKGGQGGGRHRRRHADAVEQPRSERLHAPYSAPIVL